MKTISVCFDKNNNNNKQNQAKTLNLNAREIWSIELYIILMILYEDNNATMIACLIDGMICIYLR